MNKITEARQQPWAALKLAEEALAVWSDATASEKGRIALAAIRDALAFERSDEALAEPVNVDAVNTPEKCVDKTGNNRHEPVKQEPVACIALALEALIYHTQQTRPIQKTDEAIIYLQNVLNKQEQNMSFTLEDAIKKFPEIAYWHSEFEKHNTITEPVDAKAIRAEALEEAAKVCDGIEKGFFEVFGKDEEPWAAEQCAAAIRGLK